MMQLKSTFGFCVFVGIASLFSATLSAEDAEKATKVTYEDHVKPVLRESCFACHNQNEKKGGLALDTYGSTIEGGAGGEVVYDGDSGGSRLWQLMAHEDTPVMPPGQDKLADAKIDIVRDWINGGLLENSGSKAKKKKANSLAFSSSSDGRPDGPPPMPETVWKQPVVVTERAAAVTAIRTSPWAPLVAIAGQNQVVLYNTDTTKLVGILPFPEGEPQDLSFTRDGRYLLVGGGQHSYQGLTFLYDIQTGDRVGRAGDELDVVMGSDINDTVSKVALGGPKRLVRIHDLASGEVLFELKKHTDWVYAVRYSPDGILVASGDRAGGLVLWEGDTGRLYLDLVGHKDAIRGIVWRTDSNVVASASMDGTVKLWEIAGGNQIKSLNAHGGGVTGIDMARDGRIVTCGKDRLVKLWDANGNHVRDFPAMPEAVLEVSFSHDGGKVIAGDWSGQVQMWNTDDPTIVTTLKPNPESLETRLATAKTAAQQAEATHAANVAALTDVDQQIATANEKLTAVTGQLNSAKDSLAIAEAAVLTATGEVETTSPALQALVARQPALNERIVGINGAITELTSKRDQLRATVDQAEKASLELTAKRDQAAKAIEQLDQQVADAQVDGSATPELLATLKQQHDAAAEEHRVAKEALQASLEQARTGNSELATLADSLQRVIEDRQVTQGELGALQSEIAAARTAEQAAKAALATSQQAFAEAKTIVDQQTAETTALQAKVADLTPKRAELDAVSRQSLAARDSLVADVQSLEQDLADFRSAAELLKAGEAELQAAIDASRSDAEAKLAASKTLAGTLGTEDEKMKAMAAELEALRAEVERLRSEMRNLETAEANALVTAEEAEAEKQRLTDRRSLYEAAYSPQ